MRPLEPAFRLCQATPGTDSSYERLSDEAEKIGYPIMLKAAAGGGGKGMRMVETSADLRDSIDAARREAESAFGDDRVFMERLLLRPRHVEIQILADHMGGSCTWANEIVRSNAGTRR